MGPNPMFWPLRNGHREFWHVCSADSGKSAEIALPLSSAHARITVEGIQAEGLWIARP